MNNENDGGLSCFQNSNSKPEFSLTDLILKNSLDRNIMDAEISIYELSNCSPYNPSLLTDDDLVAIMPILKQDHSKQFIAYIRRFFILYNIDTIGRITSFIGNSAEESTQWTLVAESFVYRAKNLHDTFRHVFPTVEIAQEAIGKADVRPDHQRQIAIANRVYAGKNGNGNEASGDGWKYRGRGIMQITGRGTYQSFTDDTGVDIISDPDCVETPHYSVFTGCWFWHKHKLNSCADIRAFEQLAYKINGGWPPNGWETRERFRKRALQRLKSNIEKAVILHDYRY